MVKLINVVDEIVAVTVTWVTLSAELDSEDCTGETPLAEYPEESGM